MEEGRKMLQKLSWGWRTCSYTRCVSNSKCSHMSRRHVNPTRCICILIPPPPSCRLSIAQQALMGQLSLVLTSGSQYNGSTCNCEISSAVFTLEKLYTAYQAALNCSDVSLLLIVAFSDPFFSLQACIAYMLPMSAIWVTYFIALYSRTFMVVRYF